MSSVGRNCATTLSFGRDHLHHQGTWPNTNVWLRDALEGLPEDEARLILGENVIRILGLDGATLAQVATRVDPPRSTTSQEARPTSPIRRSLPIATIVAGT